MRRIWLSMLSAAFLLGCGAVKKKTRVELPPQYGQAREASPRELEQRIGLYAGVQSLTVRRFEVQFVSVQGGYLKEYRSAEGVLAARRPDAVYVNILNPLTHSTLATLVTREKHFQIWVPKENKFFEGSTEVAGKEAEDPLLNVRPQHLLPALLIDPLPSGDPEVQYFVEEDQDSARKYYVISVFRTKEAGPALLLRKLWVERVQLTLTRQRFYEEGRLVSQADYEPPLQREGGLLVPSGVRIERPRERYTLAFRFRPENLQINAPLGEEAFQIPRPPGAEVILVQGDHRSPPQGQ